MKFADEEFSILKISVYSLKTRFQTLLRPAQDTIIRLGIKPNHITLMTCGLCLLYAALLAWSPFTTLLLALLPLMMFVRMAFNALDGMVAQASNNKTAAGAVLNEVCDVIADAALFSAFLMLMGALQGWWLLLTFLCLLTEFVSLAVYQARGFRPHVGPFGKSDRAVYLGLLAVLLVVFPITVEAGWNWLFGYVLVGIGLSTLTIWNRFYFEGRSDDSND